MRKLWIVEDAPFCSILVKKMIIGQPFDIRIASHVSELTDQVKNGDVVLLDILGTGSETFSADDGVLVIRMSSDVNLSPDLIKPFTRDQLFNSLFNQPDSRVV